MTIMLVLCPFNVENDLLFQAHLVHYNTDLYDSFGDAAKAENGLCVLGVFLKVSQTHGLELYRHSWLQIGRVQKNRGGKRQA